ncbi:dihydrofolate synthase/folylpolyglutamate synthase [Rhizobium sp. SG_E_25_P2]|uniref:bifunctional folylpolyglutamate synthase/dihydrofolate synthase n=1 Tax=Rhizobium sp. SG_E_25_P2 TaxID=2879942 RepID=UPI002475CAA0|nr:folylpolyglutamate synthase/dihydrofolate synthase family protein [Rhizobium sp. SG_E_25_P2]MDH6269317.1 dihydrofolate synthase/folylpolyglutamate synthase [Rhizobium sp. SG_E_25_P2]
MNATQPSRAEQEIERLLGIYPRGFDLSLDRIRRLLDDLGRPQDRLPPVIHIAGTNGKGSATAFSRALIEAAGLSCHVHTSPHLVRWHERYRLGAPGGGRLVSDEKLLEAVLRAEQVNAGQPITVFELLTAVIFILFSEHPADAAVIEVGLGGEFDATNVFDHPAVSLIMPIALDHQAWLGDTIEQIAAAKAGIIKRRPVVIGKQEDAAALDVLVGKAERAGVEPAIYGQDYLAYEENGRLVYQDEDGLMDLPLPALPGRHQFANAAAAIRAVKSAGFALSEEVVARAMKSVSWPARLQRLRNGNLIAFAPPGAEIWLDGGHNPHGGRAVAEAMVSFEEREPRPLYLVTGMINTKDPKGYFEAFDGLAHKVYTVAIRSSDAGLDPAALAHDAAEAGLRAEPAASTAAALSQIAVETETDPVPPRILIGGSLYFAGTVLEDNGTLPE